MSEQIDLSVPVAQPTIANYIVSSLNLDWDNARIVINLRDNTGQISTFAYTGATATALMVALNKANLTSNSLQKRIFTQLIADGKLAGTVSGAPA